MARTARKVEAGVPHHVVVRGNNRRRLFSYPSEYRLFLWLLGSALTRTRCQLHALSLTSYDVHMLLTPSTAHALSACMKHVCQVYAQTRNRRKQTTGKLFEERFFSVPLKHENDVAALTAYIDLHAEGAEISLTAEAGLKGSDTICGHPTSVYPWSTYGLHLGLPRRSRLLTQLWSPSAWYLALATTADERAQRYREHLETHCARALKLRHIQRLETKRPSCERSSAPVD